MRHIKKLFRDKIIFQRIFCRYSRRSKL